MYPRGGNGYGSAGDADGYDMVAKRQRLLSGSAASGVGSYYSSSAAAAAALNSSLNSYQPSSSSALQSSIAPYSSGSSSSLSSSLSPFLPGSPPRSTALPPIIGSYGASSPTSFDTKGSPYVSAGTSAFGGPGYMSPMFGQARAFPVVRLRGLPFNCTESDVYEFFAGLDVVDVLLTHKQGRFSGEAYCVFGAPMQVDFALQRNRQNMGQRYIEVFRSKKQEYYSAVAAEVTDIGKPTTTRETAPSLPPPKPAFSDKEHLEHTGVLKLRGLPFSASKRDIMEFFKGFGLTDDSIHFIIHSDGRATGEAYVEFSGPSESKEAMCRDKMMLGSRYVELFPTSRDEAVRAVARFKK